MGERQKRTATVIIIREPLNQCKLSHPFIPKNPQEICSDARNNFGSKHAVRLHANALSRPRNEGLETKLSYQ